MYVLDNPDVKKVLTYDKKLLFTFVFLLTFFINLFYF